jgi:hypothetical protein
VKIETDKMKILDLLQLRRSEMLTINREYQRGAVWSDTQKKKLIDSVLRCYPLPLIYLHYKKVAVAGLQRDALEIIDGQQRINTLYDFVENAFELFDPIQDEKQAKFPNFIKKTNCTWARKKYRDLIQEDKDTFDNTDIFVVKISTENDDEARDLFIRLQAGLPLNAQEKRDAWPGGYTEFVLQYGGKPEIPRYRGHDFFQKTLKPKIQDRGKIRIYCAQIGMLFFENILNNKWPDVGTRSVDEYYYENLDFDINSLHVKKFKSVLDKLVDLFLGYKGKQIKQHEAMHLVLFVNTLMCDYVPGWELNFIRSFDYFRHQNALAKKQKSGIFWDNFGMLSSTSAVQAQTVQKRHLFFSEQMLSLLKPEKKDANRIFNDNEREIVYLRYNKKCAVCLQLIDWKDLEIHHVKEHHFGGETTIDNAVPVHAKCHPKGNEAIIFSQNWNSIKAKITNVQFDDYINQIIQFCTDNKEEKRKIFLPEFTSTFYYVLQRTKDNVNISLSINTIQDIEYKDILSKFDNICIGKYQIIFDPYFNKNYGRIYFTIPISEDKEIIINNFTEFVNITKSIKK